MTVLTYRGKKYTQNKEANHLEQPVLLKYRGLEIMSKRIHEAISIEMAWFVNQFLCILKEPIKAPFLCLHFFLRTARKNKRSKTYAKRLMSCTNAIVPEEDFYLFEKYQEQITPRIRLQKLVEITPKGSMAEEKEQKAF